MFSHNNLALRNVKCDWCISFIQVATNRTHPIFENSAYFYIKFVWIHLLDIFKLVEYKSINARSALLVVVTVFLKEGQIYQNISKNHANSWGWQNVCCQTQLFCLLKKRQNSYKTLVWALLILNLLPQTKKFLLQSRSRKPFHDLLVETPMMTKNMLQQYHKGSPPNSASNIKRI